MLTAILNDFNPDCVQELKRELTQAQKGKVAENRCQILVSRIQQLINRVEKNWTDFSQDEKNILKDLAYSLTSYRKPSLWVSLRTAYTTFRASQQGYYSGIQMLVDSIDKLIDSIFSAIERESLVQSSIDFDTLDESYSDDNVVKDVGSEEIGGWLRNISNRALDEA